MCPSQAERLKVHQQSCESAQSVPPDIVSRKNSYTMRGESARKNVCVFGRTQADR
jgi:hypothetical protein